MRQRAILTFGQQPFSPFASLARELNRELAREVEREFSEAYEVPQYFETDDAFLASMDIPGVNLSDINIDQEEDKLTISATRKNPFDKTGEMTKKYSQVFILPKNIEAEKINAHYENGVLSLTLPKSEENKVKKKIQISTGQKPKSWSNFLSFGKSETEVTVN